VALGVLQGTLYPCCDPSIQHPFATGCWPHPCWCWPAAAIAKPRTDDPWEKFNRKVYAFNVKVDNAVIRPTAVVYRKITSPNVRRILSNFFAN